MFQKNLNNFNLQISIFVRPNRVAKTFSCFSATKFSKIATFHATAKVSKIATFQGKGSKKQPPFIMLAIFKKRQFSSKEIFYQCKSPFAKTFLAFSHKILENSHIFKFFVVLAKRNANFYWFVAKSSHFGYFCIYSHQKNLVATPSSKQPHWLLIATFGNTGCLQNYVQPEPI